MKHLFSQSSIEKANKEVPRLGGLSSTTLLNYLLGTLNAFSNRNKVIHGNYIPKLDHKGL